MMKIALTVILSIFLVFLIVQIWLFSSRTKDAQARFDAVNAQLQKAEKDNSQLQSDFAYYLNPLNLEKELRARFNYRLPDEKLIIIVPSPSSTAP